jgi:hypothetical protein
MPVGDLGSCGLEPDLGFGACPGLDADLDFGVGLSLVMIESFFWPCESVPEPG